ncbi:hypothetical protein Ndes2437B_g06050 [Nannochloris sp. 'desiccata']|nr:hypothetical protein KSW81_008000 [Chlorella desiccata (nom. nud.)]
MQALARSRRGALACSSGRQGPSCPFSVVGRHSSSHMLLQARSLASGRHGSGLRITSELHPNSSWGNISSRGGDRGNGSPLGLPPGASFATPTTASGANTITTSLQQRGITTYSPSSLSALPQLDTPLSEISNQLQGEGGDALTALAAVGSAVQGPVILQGAVQKVHYRSPQTAYTVLRLSVHPDFVDNVPEMIETAPSTAAASARNSQRNNGKTTNAKPRKPVITIVGTLPQIAVGQTVRVTGSWTTHHQYGQQLRAVTFDELRPVGHSDLVAYLSGGILPGVGPVTAQRMVDRYKEDIVDILDSPDAVAKLSTCEGVGRSKALKIKDGWDAGKDARLGSQFLRDAGVPAALAQRVAESLTSRTQEVVTTDPYAALGSFGLPLTAVNKVAAAMYAPADLVSRAVAAVERCLVISAEREGHTYLPWSTLENEARKLLDDLGMLHGNSWPRDEALYLVAQHMHETGRLVAEPGGDLSSSLSTPTSPATNGKSGKKRGGAFSGAHSQNTVFNKDGNSNSSSDGKVDETLKMMVTQRLSGATSQQISAMYDIHSVNLPSILSLPPIDAVRELARCKRIGPKTAEKLKLQWDAWAAQTSSSTNAASSGPRFGLQLSDLEDMPPNVPFEWGPEVRCYLPRLHKAEVAVAQAAGEKASLPKKPSAARIARIKKWISANQNTNGVELSKGQCAAIEAASDAPLLVITGGPGCGKTTVVQAIVKLWSAQGKTVHIAAPTGRAAQRMGVIQGIEPSTIHRLLKFQPRGDNSSTTSSAAAAPGDGNKAGADDDSISGVVGASEVLMNGDDIDSGPGGFFELGASNKLQSDAVLVDEASMLSLPLAAALMQALQPSTQLILIGDVDQLPPIGAGGVLHSLIHSKIAPVVDLREIFRQAAKSSIVTGALAVRQGEVPKLRHANPNADELLNSDTDAFIVRSPDADSVPDLVYETVGALAGDVSFIESDLQVITPMRKGPTGSTVLNLKLQNLLNPPEAGKHEVSRGAHGGPSGVLSAPSAGGGGAQAGERVFRVGDRVLQLVNNYDKDVFNGDQGYIVEVYPRERRLIVDFPQSGGRAAADGESRREYQGIELAQLELAYAITVHKAQGGEAKHVVMALSPHHGRMLTRRLLYTGLTRAKELLVVVAPGSGGSGNSDSFKSSSATCPLVTSVKHKDSDTRLSSLPARLEQERKGRSLMSHTPEKFSNEEEVLQGNLDAALDDSTPSSFSLVPTSTEAAVPSSASTSTSSSSPEKNESAAPAIKEAVTLPMLCEDLGLSALETENFVSILHSTLDAQQALLVSASTVHAHLAKLQAVCDKKLLGTLPELSRVLRLAPLLLVASAEYFDRGLNFADKFGPLKVVPVAEESFDHHQGEGPSSFVGRGGVNGHNDDSLVDQLRRVLGAASNANVPSPQH